MTDVLDRLERHGLPATADPRPSLLVVEADDDAARVSAHRALREQAFVREQGLFGRTDLDQYDDSPYTRTLVAVGAGGHVLGGVRVHPGSEDGAELGWWQGSRLVCGHGRIPRGKVGAALVRAACAVALREGALRFDAHVQSGQRAFFERLGWRQVRPVEVAGRPHELMRWPIERIEALAQATKAPLGRVAAPVLAGGTWLGDDGAPVPGSDVVACTDAITPSMVERDPEWAGWCGILVTAHDLAAMGAAPVGALDALGAAGPEAAERVLSGLRRASEAFGLPVMGGHTQLGVPGALSVTGIGRTERPVPGGGGSPGDRLTVTADVAGGWRPGYHGRQWDSTTSRPGSELRGMLAAVGAAQPRAAKDVSMAGIVGTAGMLAEASGCAAELDVARIPRPAGVPAGDWLTCFPGFAMVTADRAGAAPPPAAPATSAECGHLSTGQGVRLRWPDGEVTTAVSGGVTGLGPRSGGGARMAEFTMAAAAAPFGRDLDVCFETIRATIRDARMRGVDLLVLPEAALGGYVETLHGDADPPPPLRADGPELERVAGMCGSMTVCVGFCEDGGDGLRYNSAACVTGDGVIGVHRKVHLPLDEDRFTTAHDTLEAFDTPVGRIGMVICYDKAFPEAARTLALKGAEVLCILSAWPCSATNAAKQLTDDRQWRRSELWDRARAAENSFYVVSSNQTGEFGSLRFLGGARVVGPGGDAIDQTGTGPGLAVATADVPAEVEHARKALSPIRDLRPDAYVEARPLEAV